MNAAYVILDVQNDLTSTTGPGANGGLVKEVVGRKLIENTNAAIAKFRAHNVPIIFVRVGFTDDYREVSETSPMFTAIRGAGVVKLGSWGTEIHPDLDRQESDPLVTKHRVSPFYGTSLEVYLRRLNVKNLYISGVSTSVAVQSTVRDAHDRDYACTVLSDCCAAATAEETEVSMSMMSRFAKIIASADIVLEG